MDVIVARSLGAAQVARNTTTTAPIIVVTAGDPVGTGLVASLAHPGGNITGVTGMATDLSGKQLELLKEAVPSLSRVAVLWNSLDASMTLTFRGIQTAAQALGVIVQPLGVREGKDIDSALAAMTEERPDALFMITDVLTRRYTRQVVAFAAQHQLPTMFKLNFCKLGCMAYSGWHTSGPRNPLDCEGGSSDADHCGLSDHREGRSGCLW